MRLPSFTAAEMVKLGLLPFLVFMINTLLINLLPDNCLIRYQIDIPLHLLGGASIAYSATHAIALAEKDGLLSIRHPLIKIFIIVAAVMTAAVLWEFYEFLLDHFFGTHTQPNNADTMKDLFMGTAGGIVFCLGFVRKDKN